jgi:hypothetical protein
MAKFGMVPSSSESSPTVSRLNLAEKFGAFVPTAVAAAGFDIRRAYHLELSGDRRGRAPIE